MMILDIKYNSQTFVLKSIDFYVETLYNLEKLGSDKIYNKLFEQIFEPIHYKMQKLENNQ